MCCSCCFCIITKEFMASYKQQEIGIEPLF